MNVGRFFQPDKKLITWLRKYIGNRLPIDVGCGNGDFLVELNKGGIGIDPFFNGETFTLLEDHRIHIMPTHVQTQRLLLVGLNSKAIMIFARPCHSVFVEEGIDLAPVGMEILYITKPDNVEKYQDLGKYHDQKTLLKHEGAGKDKEVIYSIIKK